MGEGGRERERERNRNREKEERERVRTRQVHKLRGRDDLCYVLSEPVYYRHTVLLKLLNPLVSE